MVIDVVSDCHGNIDGLLRALAAKKITDTSGNRLVGSDHFVVSIGDLGNCVRGSENGDISCFSLVGDVFDMMLMGNHEFPYFHDRVCFSGFSWDSHINRILQNLFDADLIGVAMLAGNTLISHAGISSHFVGNRSSSSVFATIEEHWKARNFNHSWFTSIGFARGGKSPAGGILWCDFDDEFITTDFPQVVGHTPRGVRMKNNSLCIDVGAKNYETEPFILSIH